MKVVTIYTDGACRGNPGAGGWGATLTYGTISKEIFGGEQYTTNNRMEIMAAIRALEALKSPCEVVLYTDSLYLKRGITEWLPNWQKYADDKGVLRNKNKKPIKNADLWEQLSLQAVRHQVSWRWVRGHKDSAGNILADKLANKGIDQVIMQQSHES